MASSEFYLWLKAQSKGRVREGHTNVYSKKQLRKQEMKAAMRETKHLPQKPTAIHLPEFTPKMSWKARAEVMREVHQLVGQWADCRGQNESMWDVWEAGVAHWRGLLETIYPPEFYVACEKLVRDEPHDLMPIFEFLQADPLFFRSGYAKEGLLTKLKSYPLTEKDKDALRAIILQRVDDEAEVRREFRHYVRLARVLDSPEFRVALDKRSGWRVRAILSLLPPLVKT
jgi:hypothetical protein